MNNQDITQKKLQTGFPFFCYGETFALCGQPQIQDLKEFKEQSWTDIINLRSPREMDQLDFQMEEICRELNLNYHFISVIVKGDISKEALKAIHELLSQSDKTKRCVIHCASGARSVIALMAHFLFSKSHKASEIPALAETLNLHQTPMEK